MSWEAWASHRYMTSNTCFGTFATEAEARAFLSKELRETRDIDVWSHVWVKEVSEQTSETDE